MFSENGFNEIVELRKGQSNCLAISTGKIGFLQHCPQAFFSCAELWRYAIRVEKLAELLFLNNTFIICIVLENLLKKLFDTSLSAQQARTKRSIESAYLGN